MYARMAAAPFSIRKSQKKMMHPPLRHEMLSCTAVLLFSLGFASKNSTNNSSSSLAFGYKSLLSEVHEDDVTRRHSPGPMQMKCDYGVSYWIFVMSLRYQATGYRGYNGNSELGEVTAPGADAETFGLNLHPKANPMWDRYSLLLNAALARHHASMIRL